MDQADNGHERVSRRALGRALWLATQLPYLAARYRLLDRNRP